MSDANLQDRSKKIISPTPSPSHYANTQISTSYSFEWISDSDEFDFHYASSPLAAERRSPFLDGDSSTNPDFSEDLGALSYPNESGALQICIASAGLREGRGWLALSQVNILRSKEYMIF
jgi:hypothetical protein